MSSPHGQTSASVTSTSEAVAQEKLDDDLVSAKLSRQLPQSTLVRVGGDADGELLAELLGQLNSEAVRRLIINGCGSVEQTQGVLECLMG